MNHQSTMRTLYEGNGFTLIRAKNHQIWRCPCGHAQLVTPTSPCGGRGLRNSKAQIARTLRVCRTNLKEAA